MGMGRAVLVALALCCLRLAACQPQDQPQGIIRVQNGRFVDDACREFLFSGWNGWRVLDHALNNPSYITAKFQVAQENNLKVMRFFLGDDDGSPVLQTAPGQFDERVAKALDWLLAQAAAYGIKVTPVLLNQWKKNNGVPQFEQWCGTSGSYTQPRPDLDPSKAGLTSTARLQTPYDWLMSNQCRQQVKNYFSALVNRRNTVTGLLYKEDPTILSWNILNEPRCRYCGTQAVDSWVAELSAHLKSEDPNHLVTTGAEGFFVEGDPAAGADPQDGTMWASRSGQDFRANHAHAAVDYAVIHLWPDNWRKTPFDVAWGQQWIDAHSQVAASLGKPLVLEEFGKEAGDGNITSVRDPWFVMVNGAVADSLASGGALRAALFWQWDGDSGPRPGLTNSIRQSDSTFTNYIAPFAKQVMSQDGTPVPGCQPRSSAGSSAASSSPVQALVGGGSGGGSQGQGAVQSFAGSAGRKLMERV